jgi:hypothetical protein
MLLGEWSDFVQCVVCHNQLTPSMLQNIDFFSWAYVIIRSFGISSNFHHTAI